MKMTDYYYFILLSGLLLLYFLKTTKFMSNVLEAISKLKLKNSKNHFSNLVLYLPAYS